MVKKIETILGVQYAQDVLHSKSISTQFYINLKTQSKICSRFTKDKEKRIRVYEYRKSPLHKGRHKEHQK